jgi:cytochrome P450
MKVCSPMGCDNGFAIGTNRVNFNQHVYNLSSQTWRERKIAPAVRTLPAAKDILSLEFLQNPYRVYADLCEEAAIHRINLNGPRWALVRYAECFAFLRDPRLSSAGRVRLLLSRLPPETGSNFGELERGLEMWMLLLDAPEHTRLRKLMNKGFSPAIVEALRTQVEAMVDAILDAAAPAGVTRIDIVRDVAYPLPVRVIAEMLGVPTSQHREFIAWTNALALFFGSPVTNETARAAQDAVLAVTDFFRKIVADRRRHKGSDLISLLIGIEEDGHVLTEEELYAQCVLLLFGGHETTRNLIANGLYTLLKHPEEMADLRRNPEIIRTAVEELLRYESPVQYVSRVAKAELEIAGLRIPAGDSVVFLLAAANRDPRKFDDPDRLNLKRARNDHLAFGAGAHFCIGSQLARLEGQVAILKLLQKFPAMRLASEPPEWVPNFNIRGLKSLMVEV